MGLLVGEACGIVNKADVFKSSDLDSAFKQIRRLLDSFGHPSKYRQEFHGKKQRPDEDVRSFGRVLQQKSQRAHPGEVKEKRERRVLEQLIDIVSNQAVNLALLRGKFDNLVQVLSTGEAVERAVTGMPAGNECCALRGWRPRIQQPASSPANWRRSWYRGSHTGTCRPSYSEIQVSGANRWYTGPHNSPSGPSYSQPVGSGLPLYGTRPQTQKQANLDKNDL